MPPVAVSLPLSADAVDAAAVVGVNKPIYHDFNLIFNFVCSTTMQQ